MCLHALSLNLVVPFFKHFPLCVECIKLLWVTADAVIAISVILTKIL